MDNRIRIRNGPQTARVTVTITTEQRARLEALAGSSGFNVSELVRYSLVQLFKYPHVFLSGNLIDSKAASYHASSHGEPGEDGALDASRSATPHPIPHSPPAGTGRKEESHAD